MRSGDPVAAPSPATTASNGTPHHSAAAAAASAFGTWCAPCSASRTSRAPGRRQPETRPEVGVEHDVLGTHVGVALHRVAQHGHGLTEAMRATRASSKFRTATPEGGRAATSSLLARATPSRSPKYSTCAMATLVTMPTSGRATRASA